MPKKHEAKKPLEILLLAVMIVTSGVTLCIYVKNTGNRNNRSEGGGIFGGGGCGGGGCGGGGCGGGGCGGG